MKLTTFLYHEINNTPSEFHKLNNLSVTEDVFYDQLRFIKNEFNIINPKDLIKNKFKEQNNALITFDDSSKGIIENAIPILKELKIPALFFLNMDVITTKENYMTKIFYIMKNFDTEFKNNNIRNIFSKDLSNFFSKINFIEYKIFSGKWIELEDLLNLKNSNEFYIGNHLYNHYSVKYLNQKSVINQYRKNEELLKNYNNYLPLFSYPFGQFKLDYDKFTNKLITNLGAKYIFTANLINRKINKNIIHRVPLFNNIKGKQIYKHIKNEYFKSNIRFLARLLI